jgi:hypothetical protein
MSTLFNKKFFDIKNPPERGSLWEKIHGVWLKVVK